MTFDTSRAFSSSDASSHQDAILAAMMAGLRRATPPEPTIEPELIPADIRAMFWRKGRAAYVPLTAEDAARQLKVTVPEARVILARGKAQGILSSEYINCGSSAHEKCTVYSVRDNRASKVAARKIKTATKQDRIEATIRNMAQDGATTRDIAQALGLHTTTVARRIRGDDPAVYARVLEASCERNGVSVDNAMSASRIKAVFITRAEAWLQLQDMGWSLPRISAQAGRDHTTVLSGIQKVRVLPRAPE